MNKNELILDRVRSATYHDLETGDMIFRLTSLEDPTLTCTAEGEEVTDAIGALITTIYRAKQATFSATNSLLSLDLAAAQYGTTKVVGTDSDKIVDYTYEILKSATNKLTLSHTPITGTVKYIYAMEDGDLGTKYEYATTAGEGKFTLEGTEITLPTVTDGTKFFVEYTYENANAISIVNKASEYPEAGSLIIYAYFRDKCNENKLYSGKIIVNKAKLNPESIELALTSTGKHPFEFRIMKDYCADEGSDELFQIIVSE
jgi:hypothetical protein